MDPVMKNLKRAYREIESRNMPDKMAELLRKLQEQDAQEHAGAAN